MKIIPLSLLLIIFILCSDKIFFWFRIPWKMLLRKQWHIACARLNMAGPWYGLCRGNVLSIGISNQISHRLPNVSYVELYKIYCESWYLCGEIIFYLVIVFSFWLFRCGLVGSGPDCELIEDLTLPYPACCPKIRCSKTSRESEDTKPNELHISSNNINLQLIWIITRIFTLLLWDKKKSRNVLAEEERRIFEIEVFRKLEDGVVIWEKDFIVGLLVSTLAELNFLVGVESPDVWRWDTEWDRFLFSPINNWLSISLSTSWKPFIVIIGTCNK